MTKPTHTPALQSDTPLVIPVAWGEMDALGHVNNIVYFRYMESARVAFLLRLGINRLESEAGIGVILQSVQARFRRPIVYPDTVHVISRVTSVERDRFTLEHDIRSEKLGEIAAIGSGVIVSYDYERAAKVDLPERWATLLRECLR
ncbi:MAG: acyl-CoA thioesterase [Phycisphaerales bacterium]|nr:MAG: acyl-CoA thioesterase [Phycisphaerales bacterium]